MSNPTAPIDGGTHWLDVDLAHNLDDVEEHLRGKGWKVVGSVPVADRPCVRLSLVSVPEAGVGVHPVAEAEALYNAMPYRPVVEGVGNEYGSADVSLHHTSARPVVDSSEPEQG